MMRKIIAITQVTVDGVMQGPGGPEEDPTNGFNQGRTFQIFAGYWPDKNGPIAKAFNKATKYVVSQTLNQLAWEKSVQIKGDVVDQVRRLKISDGPELHIWGSSVLLQSLIAADLIDECRFWIAPVVLGEGKRLFQNGIPPRVLSLVETRSTPKGLLINTYRPAASLPRV